MTPQQATERGVYTALTASAMLRAYLSAVPDYGAAVFVDQAPESCGPSAVVFSVGPGMGTILYGGRYAGCHALRVRVLATVPGNGAGTSKALPHRVAAIVDSILAGALLSQPPWDVVLVNSGQVELSQIGEGGARRTALGYDYTAYVRRDGSPLILEPGDIPI